MEWGKGLGLEIYFNAYNIYVDSQLAMNLVMPFMNTMKFLSMQRLISMRTLH